MANQNNNEIPKYITLTEWLANNPVLNPEINESEKIENDVVENEITNPTESDKENITWQIKFLISFLKHKTHIRKYANACFLLYTS